MFVGRFFGEKKKKKKKFTTKTLKEIDSISRSCSPVYQGRLMKYAKDISDIVKTEMETAFSEEEMSVEIKFLNKSDRDFYLLDLARGLDSLGTSGAYSNNIGFTMDDRYQVKISITVYVVNDTRDGSSISKKFYDTVAGKCEEYLRKKN